MTHAHGRDPGTALPVIELVLRAEYITLDALLKSTGLAPSGGAAKAMVAEGRVRVDGRAESRKTCKLRAGQLVQVGDAQVRVRARDAEAEPTQQARDV